jgi:uracil-DNA glycosylase
MSYYESIGNVKERAEDCHDCACSKSRTHVVIYRGMVEPRVLFVGQSPGPKEDELGVPFVGPAGSMFEQAIIEHGMDSFGVINIINCFPPNNKFQKEFGVACRPFLIDKLHIFAPAAKYLVTLGRDAEEAIQYVQLQQPNLLSHLKLHHIIHPAAVLRNRSWQSTWEEGWRQLEGRIRDGH